MGISDIGRNLEVARLLLLVQQDGKTSLRDRMAAFDAPFPFLYLPAIQIATAEILMCCLFLGVVAAAIRTPRQVPY